MLQYKLMDVAKVNRFDVTRKGDAFCYFQTTPVAVNKHISKTIDIPVTARSENGESMRLVWWHELTYEKQFPISQPTPISLKRQQLTWRMVSCHPHNKYDRFSIICFHSELDELAKKPRCTADELKRFSYLVNHLSNNGNSFDNHSVLMR